MDAPLKESNMSTTRLLAAVAAVQQRETPKARAAVAPRRAVNADRPDEAVAPMLTRIRQTPAARLRVEPVASDVRPKRFRAVKSCQAPAAAGCMVSSQRRV